MKGWCWDENPHRAILANGNEGATDRRFRTESNLLHAIKMKLQEMGYDVIKKRMSKDGHMVSDYCQYIRSRLTTDKRFFGIWDDQYAIRMLHEDWNKEGAVSLAIVGVENFRPTLATQDGGSR